MKALKITIFILLIILLYISIKFYIETQPLRMIKKMEIYINETTENRHSRNEHFMYESTI